MHHFSIEKSSASREVLLEPLMEEFNLEVIEKIDFENLFANIDNFFWQFLLVTNQKQRKNIHTKGSVRCSRQDLHERQRNRTITLNETCFTDLT